MYFLRQTPAAGGGAVGTASVGVQVPTFGTLPNITEPAGGETNELTVGPAAAGDALSATSGDTMHTAVGSSGDPP
eukprot:5210680-Alexandrium_andersonii.AAC.1